MNYTQEVSLLQQRTLGGHFGFILSFPYNSIGPLFWNKSIPFRMDSFHIGINLFHIGTDLFQVFLEFDI